MMRKALIALLLATTIAAPAVAEAQSWQGRGQQRDGGRGEARSHPRPDMRARQMDNRRGEVRTNRGRTDGNRWSDRTRPARPEVRRPQQDRSPTPSARPVRPDRPQTSGMNASRWQDRDRGDRYRNRPNERRDIGRPAVRNDNRRADVDRRWDNRRSDNRRSDNRRWDNDRRDDRRWNDGRWNDGRRNDNRWDDRRNDWRWTGNDRRDRRDDRWNNRDRQRWDDRRWADDRRWDRDWRRDNRYDWRRYRSTNRSIYRASRYYPPRGYGYDYRRWSHGYRLPGYYYAQDYWLDDPWYYRLPPAYGPYRWVRYYDDVLLVDITDGLIQDIIYSFFWR